MLENVMEANTEDSQVSAKKRKKKKEEKSRRLNEENSQVEASPLFCLIPGSFEEQDTEDHESVRKKPKKKKKAEQELSDSTLDNSQVTAGNGLTKDGETKKKKKKKSRPQDGDNSLLESSPPSSLLTTSLEEQDREDHEKVRKRKKAEEEPSDSPMDNSQVTAGNGLNKDGDTKKKKKKAEEELSNSPLDNSQVTAGNGLNKDGETKKKKKKKAEEEPSDSPMDNSQVTAGNGLNKDGETKKKKKKKAEEELSDSTLDNSQVTAGNGLNKDGETKKKKKKKAEEEPSNSLLDNSQVTAGNGLNKDGETKKKKKKAEEEPSDSPLDNSQVTAGNGLTKDGETKKKKKQKSRPHDGDNSLLESSPPSSLLTTSLEEQDREDHESVRKKSKKKKAEKEPSYSPLGNSWDPAGNELNGGVEASICEFKKKKKKKHLADGQQGDDAQFMVPETQEDDISENLHLVSNPTAKDKNVELSPAKQSGAQDCVPETPEKLHGLPTTPSLGPPVSEKVPKKRRATGGLAKQKNRGKSSSDHEEGNSGSGVSGTQDLLDLTQAAVDSSRKQKSGQKRTVSELGEGRPARVRKRARSTSAEVSDVPGDAEETEKPAGKAKKRLRGTPLKSRASKGKHKRHTSSRVVHSDAEASDAEDQEQLPKEDLDTLIKHLEEFIPHVRNLAEEGIRQLACRDLERFRKFKKQGIAVKFGKFSQKENTQLWKNVEDFMEDYEIDSAEKLFFPHRFPEELEYLKKLRKDNFFALKIAENIPRPWRLVYYRARKMFDPLNYNGRYSEAELKKIKKYQAMYGNNWKKISEMMCRSSHSLEDRYSAIRSNPNHGPWTTEEIQKLLKVMKSVLWLKVKKVNSATGGQKKEQDLRLSHEMLYKNIPWAQVEDEVETRTWRQCKRKWFIILAHKMCRWEKKNHNLEVLKIKIGLIERLYELRVEDQNEIDWLEISKNLGGLPPTYVQGVYYRLKISFVADWHKKSFTDIITLLHDVKLPELKNLLDELAQRKSVQPSQRNATDSKDTYLFSEIFSDSDLEVGLDSEKEEHGS